MPISLAYLCLYLAYLSVLTRGVQPASNGPAPAPLSAEPAEVRAIASRVAALLDDVVSFWKAHGLDRQYGGFYGTLNQQGQSVDTVFSSSVGLQKGLVQTAR